MIFHEINHPLGGTPILGTAHIGDHHNQQENPFSTPTTSSGDLVKAKVHVNMVIPGYGGFHKIGLPQKWMVYRKNAIKIDDLGVPLFQETSIWKSG